MASDHASIQSAALTVVVLDDGLEVLVLQAQVQRAQQAHEVLPCTAGTTRPFISRALSQPARLVTTHPINILVMRAKSLTYACSYLIQRSTY